MLKSSRFFISLSLFLTLGGQLLAEDNRYQNYQRLLLIENDSLRCSKLIDYAVLMTDSLADYDFSLLIFEKANTVFTHSTSRGLAVKLYSNWAYAYWVKGSYPEAEKLFSKALKDKHINDDLPFKAKILNMAAVTLQNLMFYKRALGYYNEALVIYSQIGNVKGKGTVYQNMANIFALAGDLKQSDLFFDKAIDIFLRNGIMENYGTVMGNKAFVKRKQGKLDTAKAILIRSLHIPGLKITVAGGFVDRYFNLGLTYAELKKWDSCFYCLNKGKQLSDSMNASQRYNGNYYYYLGYCHFLEGDLKKAILFYKEALSKKDGLDNCRFLYQNIAKTYLKDKQYDSAFVYKNKALDMIDSVYSEEIKDHITFENKRVELMEKEYQNQLRYTARQQSLSRLETRNYIFISVIILLMILVLFLFLYFRQYRLRTKKEHLQSELDFLRAQLNPHFLFNSINNIYVLLDNDKVKAREILMKFSDLMRYQLYECNVGSILLKKELQFLENYIEFEKLRYSNKISVYYDLGIQDAGELMIAPLLLQPFIENAFKHTPRSRTGMLHIEIHGSVKGRSFLFTVSNLASASDRSTLPGGIGLKNVIKRLKLVYSKKHKLKILRSEDQYKIILNLQLEEESPPRSDP